jgi:hypothetical protein
VAALTAHACVVIDYRTGRTQLRRVPSRPAEIAGTVVQLAGALPSWGTGEAPAILPGRLHVPFRWRLAAVPAVVLTMVVRTCGARSSRFRRLVRLACAGRSLPPAANDQARYAVRAVRWTARAVPARWACLEESVAASALLAMSGRRAEWRHGVATDPVRMHAWIVDRRGRPVEEPSDTALYTSTYTPDGPGPDTRVGRETRP